MPACSVNHCNARKTKNQSQLTLHRFPRSNPLRRKWLDIVGSENINPRHKQLFLCSFHFEDSCFNRTLDVVRLHNNSVPSLSLLGSSESEHHETTNSGSRSSPGKKRTRSSTPSAITGAEDVLAEYLRDEDCIDDDGRLQTFSFAETDGGSGYQHESCYCNGCSNDICGFRYVCIQCPDYDLCAACEAARLHDAHYMLRVPGRSPEEEISSILNRIREELFKCESIAESIKMEFEEEPDGLGAAEGSNEDLLVECQEKINSSRVKHTTENTGHVTDHDIPNRSRMETRKPLASHHKVVNTEQSTDDVTVAADNVLDIKVDAEMSEQSVCEVFVHRAPASLAVSATTGAPGRRGAAPRRGVVEATCAAAPPPPATHPRLAVIPGTYVLELSAVRKESDADRDMSRERKTDSHTLMFSLDYGCGDNTVPDVSCLM